MLMIKRLTVSLPAVTARYLFVKHPATDGKSDKVKDGEIEVDGKKFKIRELASQEMKTSAGATWDAPTAGNALSGT